MLTTGAKDKIISKARQSNSFGPISINIVFHSCTIYEICGKIDYN